MHMQICIFIAFVFRSSKFTKASSLMISPTTAILRKTSHFRPFLGNISDRKVIRTVSFKRAIEAYSILYSPKI